MTIHHPKNIPRSLAEPSPGEVVESGAPEGVGRLL
jgi:hypothetical protein